MKTPQKKHTKKHNRTHKTPQNNKTLKTSPKKKKVYNLLLGHIWSIIGGSCHKYDFCRDKTRLLSRRKYACCDKTLLAPQPSKKEEILLLYYWSHFDSAILRWRALTALHMLFVHIRVNNNNILYSSLREIKAVVRSHNEEPISIILSSLNARTYLRHTPPFSQSAYTNSKPKISGNNAFSVKPKRKNSEPSLRKLSSTDVLMHAHTQLMTGIIFIKNWQSRG